MRDPNNEPAQTIRAFLSKGGTLTNLETALNAGRSDPHLLWGGVESQDLTNDGVPEIIVWTSNPSSRFDHTLIFSCHAGDVGVIYQAVSLHGQFESWIQDIVDMNGNGIPELLQVNVTVGANDEDRQYVILEWNGSEFADLIDPRWPWHAEMFNGIATIEVTNGDGLLDLELIGGTDSGYSSCGTVQRTRTDVWRYNGQMYVKAESTYQPPTYRYQALVDGDWAFLRQEYDRALAAYQQAIFDESLQPSNWVEPLYGFCGDSPGYYRDMEGFNALDERSAFEAYARYRIMQVHLLRSDDGSAKIAYEALRRRFPAGVPGHVMVGLATAFRQAFLSSHNVAQACEAANEAAGRERDSLLATLTDVRNEVLYESPYFHLDPEQYLCPYQ